MPKCHYVYILASLSRRLYIGHTSKLPQRVWQHRSGLIPGFTRKYRIRRLVYFEETLDARAANERERALKGWRREKKLRLIESMNPGWLDLAENWFPGEGD